MVYKKKTVVYEICQKNIAYVISSNGSIRMILIPASLKNAPELGNEETVHIYDAKASSGQEPSESDAFLIEFTSRNSKNYAQTIRRCGIDRYTIPNYLMEELQLYCQIFGVLHGDVCGLDPP
jgi:hypothetical protein